MLNRKNFLKVLLASLALAASGAGWAQAFPSKPVRLILGAPAGTAPDTAARIVGEKLAALWGQSVVVENKPGVGGMLAMDFVKAAPADGHTLMFAHAGAVLVTPKFIKAAKYDPVNDFTTLGYVADSPMIIVAGNEVAEKTLPDMLKFAKANPGKIALGSTEQSTLPFLVGTALRRPPARPTCTCPLTNPARPCRHW